MKVFQSDIGELIGGKNDSLETADQLANLAGPLEALVNLLPLHPGGAPDLTPSTRAQTWSPPTARRSAPAVFATVTGFAEPEG